MLGDKDGRVAEETVEESAEVEAVEDRGDEGGAEAAEMASWFCAGAEHRPSMQTSCCSAARMHVVARINREKRTRREECESKKRERWRRLRGIHVE